MGAGEGADAIGKWLEVWNTAVLSLPWLLFQRLVQKDPGACPLKSPREGGPAWPRWKQRRKLPHPVPFVHSHQFPRVTSLKVVQVVAKESPRSSYPSLRITDLLTVLFLELLVGVGRRG